MVVHGSRLALAHGGEVAAEYAIDHDFTSPFHPDSAAAILGGIVQKAAVVERKATSEHGNYATPASGIVAEHDIHDGQRAILQPYRAALFPMLFPSMSCRFLTVSDPPSMSNMR